MNCRNKIERKLRNTAGVKNVAVSYNTGIAKITFDSDLISSGDIIAAIEKLGYEVLPEQQAKPSNIKRTIGLLIIIIALYGFLQRFGVLNLLVPSQLADSKMGYGMLFLVGFITSVHCIAMCGGINLSQCIPKKAVVDAGSRRSAFVPSLLYNAGRVISYTVIGFLLGIVGMLAGEAAGGGLSNPAQGVLKLIAGIFMVIMGINMLGIFPWLRKFQPRIPNAVMSKVSRWRTKGNQPLFVGLLNGLMPCGPLQAMQVIALASGNPVTGALSMFVFSLGTVPLMFGLGSIVSVLGQKFTKAVMNVGAVLVTVLGLAMFSQGGSLTGFLLPDRLLFAVVVLSILGVVVSIPCSNRLYRIAGAAIVLLFAVITADTVWAGENTSREVSQEKTASDGESGIQMEDGAQVVNSTLLPRKYPDIVVQAGIPVKWKINAPSGSINGCNYKLIIPDYGIEHAFEEGENVIEFTPTESGDIYYSCWMGMIWGTISVVESTDETAEVSEVTTGNETPGSGAAEASVVNDSCCMIYQDDSCCISGTGGSCCN